MPGAIAFGILCAVVVVAAVCDIRTHRVPNALTFSAVAVGLIMWTVIGAAGVEGLTLREALGNCVLGLLSALIPFAILYGLGGLGGGDVKLMTAVGTIGASWQIVLATSFYAFIAGALFAIAIMIRHGLVVRTLRRLFSAALFAAAKVKPEIPEDSPKVPFALAIAVGAVLAGCEHLLNVNLPWSAYMS